MDAPVTQPLTRSPISVKLIVGLFFTAFGILLAAGNLDLINSRQYLEWWPVVLIAIGLVKLGEQGSRPAALILLVIGTSLLIYNLGLVPFTIFDLWPLLLIGGGIYLVMRAFGVPVAGTPETRVDSINATAVLATRRISSNSRTFSGGNLFAFMSNCEIDLTGADISGGPAIIDATAIWAGIEIFVPENWEVIGEVMPFMGGFDLKPGASPDSKRQLIVRGLAWMGGIEVKTRRMS